MRLLLIKILVLLFCIPLYPLVLFAEYYNAKTGFGTFNFRKESKFYWKDVRNALLFRKEGD